MPIKQLFSFLCLLLVFAACVPTKRLHEGEELLYAQSVKGNKRLSTEQLEVFYRQKPNSRMLYLPITPYLYAYYLGEASFEKQKPKYRKKLEKISQKLQAKIDSIEGDSEHDLVKKQRLQTKLNTKTEKLNFRLQHGNWLMTTVGEAPAVFDSAAMLETQNQMQLFLKQKGHFENKVSTQRVRKGKKLSVTYQVVEGKPHRIRQVSYQIADNSICKLVQADTSNCLFEKGQIYDEGKLVRERDRITELLRNHGYFHFNKNYIFFDIDTNLVESHLLDIQLVIAQEEHPIFHLDSVQVYIDTAPKKAKEVSEYDRVLYYTDQKKYAKSILDTKIYLRPDSLFSHKNALTTQQALGAMNMFKFINVRYDTTGGAVSSRIFLNSYSKYNISLEGGVNVTQALPGPFFSVGLQNRNIFNGSEILQIQARGLIEAQTSLSNANDNIRTQEYNLNVSLTLPHFLFPMKQVTRRKFGKLAPQTELRLGYAFIDRLEYNRVSFQALMGYAWRNRKFASYRINPFDINLALTRKISTSFQEYIIGLFQDGSTLLYSFNSSFVTSMSGSYTFNNNLSSSSNRRRAHYLRLYLEPGGSFLNNAFNTVDVSSPDIFKVEDLPFFPYVKWSIDYRRYRPKSKDKLLATRLHIGLAYPFGNQEVSGVLPYEKYLFVGGSNSIRAWNPRRLGPGSFTPNLRDDGTFDYRFEQNGELLLEASIELRKNLFSFVDGALFLDAGNIWMLNQDAREGGQFEVKDFWKEIAMGVGFGLRFDFAFLIVRGDMGIKAYDPARPLGNRFILDNISWKDPLGTRGQSVFNIAVGYPF